MNNVTGTQRKLEKANIAFCCNVFFLLSLQSSSFHPFNLFLSPIANANSSKTKEQLKTNTGTNTHGVNCNHAWLTDQH